MLYFSILIGQKALISFSQCTVYMQQSFEYIYTTMVMSFIYLFIYWKESPVPELLGKEKEVAH